MYGGFISSLQRGLYDSKGYSVTMPAFTIR